jgi:hypothetical protein
VQDRGFESHHFDLERKFQKNFDFCFKFQDEDKIVRVYGCATMWHENSEEMAEMLKSIFRMDEDYAAR